MPSEILDAHVTAGPAPYFPARPDELLAQMDRHGINRAMLAPVDRWLAVDNREGNDTIIEWVHHWPDRFLGYATANPWYGERAVAELDRALDAGLSAVKLHPARQGFVLVEPIVDPILELAARRAVPVYVVTGVPIAAMPLQLAEIARRYPEVPFIMGRSGRTDFWQDALPAAEQAPNIYLETVYNLPGTLEGVVRRLGGDRLIFASDAPLTSWELELRKLERLQVTPEVRKAILHHNFVRLLRLGKEGSKYACH